MAFASPPIPNPTIARLRLGLALTARVEAESAITAAPATKLSFLAAALLAWYRRWSLSQAVIIAVMTMRERATRVMADIESSTKRATQQQVEQISRIAAVTILFSTR
jgi:hypothetical protein